MVSLGQRQHFKEDQAISCQSPRTGSTMQAEHPTPKAVSTDPSGSLQGSGTHGWKKSSTAARPFCWLPRTTWETEPRLGPLPQGWRGHSWLLPGGGGSLPPLTVDSIEKGRIPEPQRVPAGQNMEDLPGSSLPSTPKAMLLIP